MTAKPRAERRRVLKTGSITYDLGAGIECAIRNMSDTGALLESQADSAIPNEFSLVIRPEGIRRNCRIVWRNGRRFGVEFI